MFSINNFGKQKKKLNTEKNNKLGSNNQYDFDSNK